MLSLVPKPAGLELAKAVSTHAAFASSDYSSAPAVQVYENAIPVLSTNSTGVK